MELNGAFIRLDKVDELITMSKSMDSHVALPVTTDDPVLFVEVGKGPSNMTVVGSLQRAARQKAMSKKNCQL